MADPLFVVFSVEGRTFALPAVHAERAVPAVAPSALADAPPWVMGTIDVHGKILPLVDLGVRLGGASRPLHPADQFLLLCWEGRRLAVRVDAVDGVTPLDVTQAVAPQTLLPELSAAAALEVLPGGPRLIRRLDLLVGPRTETAWGGA